MDKEVDELSNDNTVGGDARGEAAPETPIEQGSGGGPWDLRVVSIARVHPHPLNPRLVADEELIRGVQERATQRGTYDETQPLVVREVDEGFEILSGHHRFQGYQRAGLAEVLVHVVKVDEREAMLALERYNRQNPLGSLELAFHAANLLHQGIAADQKEAATMLGLSAQQLSRFLGALRVLDRHKRSCAGSTKALRDRAEHLYLLRELPFAEQEAIIKRMIADDLSKSEVKKLVATFERDRNPVTVTTAVPAVNLPPSGGEGAPEQRDAVGVGMHGGDGGDARRDGESPTLEVDSATVEPLNAEVSNISDVAVLEDAASNRLVLDLEGYAHTETDGEDVTLYRFPENLPDGIRSTGPCSERASQPSRCCT